MLEVIEMKLTSEQINDVAPIVRAAAAAGRNCVFISTFSPDLNVWRWQVVSLRRHAAQKIIRAIIAESKEKDNE
jgi:hypothetical protein